MNTEMRKHFQMTEEVLALMLERREVDGRPGAEKRCAGSSGAGTFPGWDAGRRITRWRHAGHERLRLTINGARNARRSDE